ncbi:MAG: hypothetical protein WCT03_04490 [Candidatus Obscuribacterales bacterium]|jgi:hypothetical protein
MQDFKSHKAKAIIGNRETRTLNGMNLYSEETDKRMVHLVDHLFPCSGSGSTLQWQFDQEVSEALVMLAAVSEQMINRRQQVNQFFIALNVGVYAIFNNQNFNATLCWVGIVTCIIWWLQLRDYQIASTSKIELFKALELNRTVRPLSAQYKFVNANGYLGLTKLEQYLPFIIGFAYLWLALAHKETVCEGCSYVSIVL